MSLQIWANAQKTNQTTEDMFRPEPLYYSIAYFHSTNIEECRLQTVNRVRVRDSARTFRFGSALTWLYDLLHVRAFAIFMAISVYRFANEVENMSTNQPTIMCWAIFTPMTLMWWKLCVLWLVWDESSLVLCCTRLSYEGYWIWTCVWWIAY